MARSHPRALGWGLYGVAVLLVAMPILDVTLQIWPLRWGQVAWRVGTVGLLSQSVVSPLLGLVLALVTAVALEHPLRARVTSVLSLSMVLGASATMAVFALDLIETRATVRPEAAFAYDAASVIAVIKFAAGMAVASLIGVAAWQSANRIERSLEGARGRDDSGAPGIVRAESRRASEAKATDD